MSNEISVIINQRMLLDSVMEIRAKFDITTDDGREGIKLTDNLIQMITYSKTDASQQGMLPKIRSSKH